MSGMKNETGRCALVIGATGGIGGEVSKALIQRGWRVKALHRAPENAKAHADWIGPVEWVAGDAMCRGDVVAAAEDAEVIVHAANPPAYRNWRGLALPMLGNAIEAARTSGARLVLPGNIYNFGPDALPLITETSPQNPQTRKGAVRVEMEEMLIRAAGQGVRSLVVRAGDYFGPRQPDSWLRAVMVKPGRPVRSVTYPGDPDVGHNWAYLPDVAAAMGRLIAIERDLADFEVVNFAGHWLDRGGDFARAIGRVAGVENVPVRRFPWVLVRLGSPFVRLFRELWEMRYLWQVPARLDNARLERLIGPEPRTPLDLALQETLEELGCIEAPRRVAAAV